MCDYKMGRMRGDLSEFSNKLRLIEKDLHPFQSRYSKEVEKCCDRIQELETHVAGNARSFDGSVARAARKDLNDYLRYNSENFNDWHDFVEETDKVVDQMDTMRGYVYRVVPRMENQVNDTSDALKEMCKENSRLRKRVGTLTERLDELTERLDRTDQTLAHWMITIRKTGAIPPPAENDVGPCPDDAKPDEAKSA